MIDDEDNFIRFGLVTADLVAEPGKARGGCGVRGLRPTCPSACLPRWTVSSGRGPVREDRYADRREPDRGRRQAAARRTARSRSGTPMFWLVFDTLRDRRRGRRCAGSSYPPKRWASCGVTSGPFVGSRSGVMGTARAVRRVALPLVQTCSLSGRFLPASSFGLWAQSAAGGTEREDAVFDGRA